MYENKSEPLLSRRAFCSRVARSFAVTVVIVTFSLLMGSAGYHYLGDLPWIDSLLNASMILTGMGPVDPLKSSAAKLFASFYALYSGIAFLTMVAILMAPLLHRFLHTFHLEVSAEDDEKEEKPGS
jgi:putative effector of murein hydrolase